MIQEHFLFISPKGKKNKLDQTIFKFNLCCDFVCFSITINFLIFFLLSFECNTQWFGPFSFVFFLHSFKFSRKFSIMQMDFRITMACTRTSYHRENGYVKFDFVCYFLRSCYVATQFCQHPNGTYTKWTNRK